jgi:hypothetical protein
MFDRRQRNSVEFAQRFAIALQTNLEVVGSLY